MSFEKRLKLELKKTDIIKNKLSIKIVNISTVYGFALQKFFEEKFSYLNLEKEILVRGTCLEEEIISRFESWVDSSEIRLMKTIPLEEIIDYAKARGWSNDVEENEIIKKINLLELKHPGLKFGLSKSFSDLEEFQ